MTVPAPQGDPGRAAGSGDRVCLVTGAARGIGAAVVRRLLAEGSRIVLTDLNRDEAVNAAQFLDPGGERVLAAELDVTSEDAWIETIARVEDELGALDVLVANAGVLLLKRIEDTRLDEFRHVERVNVEGVFLAAKHAIRLMKSPDRRARSTGSMVMMSSMGGLRGVDGAAAYSASKGAVRLFAKSAALEFARYNVRVNSVHPGLVDTPMGRDALGLRPETDPDARLRGAARAFPLGRVAEPDDVAEGVAYLASERSSFVTGSELVIDGGWTAR